MQSTHIHPSAAACSVILFFAFTLISHIAYTTRPPQHLCIWPSPKSKLYDWITIVGDWLPVYWLYTLPCSVVNAFFKWLYICPGVCDAWTTFFMKHCERCNSGIQVSHLCVRSYWTKTHAADKRGMQTLLVKRFFD